MSDTITNAQQYTDNICKKKVEPTHVEYQITWQYQNAEKRSVNMPKVVIDQLE